MKKILLLLSLISAAFGAQAQFSSDAANPLVVCNSAGIQKAVKAVNDDFTAAKGYFVFWLDNRNLGNSVYEIYGQRLDSNGNALWEPNGRKIVTSPNGISAFTVIRWRQGLLLTYVIKADSISSIYLKANGKNRWAQPSLIAHYDSNNGVLGVSAAGCLNSFATSAGAAITYYITYFGGSANIGYNKIDINGVVAFPNNSNHYPLSGYDYRSASDGNDGLYLLSKGNGLGSTITIDRINSNGTKLWVNGLEITGGGDGNGFGGNISMNTSSTGTLYVTWDSYNYNIYISKILSNGTFGWAQQRIGLSASSPLSASHSFARIGKNDSVYVTWNDVKNGTVYAMMQKTGQGGGISLSAGGKIIDTSNGLYSYPKLAFEGNNATCVFASTGSTVTVAAQELRPNNKLLWPDTKLLCDSYLKWTFYQDYTVLDGSKNCNAVFWTGFDENIYGAKTCVIPSSPQFTNMPETAEAKSNIINTNALNVSAYPNPVQNILHINLSNKPGLNASICVCDLSGRVLKTFEISEKNTLLDISSFSSGIYLIRYADDKNKSIIKITKE